MALLAGLHMLLVRAATASFLGARLARSGGVLVALLAGLHVLLVRSALTSRYGETPIAKLKVSVNR